jgi:hypothetical protein
MFVNECSQCMLKQVQNISRIGAFHFITVWFVLPLALIFPTTTTSSFSTQISPVYFKTRVFQISFLSYPIPSFALVFIHSPRSKISFSFGRKQKLKKNLKTIFSLDNRWRHLIRQSKTEKEIEISAVLEIGR